MPTLHVSEMKILSWPQEPESSQAFPHSNTTQSQTQAEQGEHMTRQPQKSPSITLAERTPPGGKEMGQLCVKTCEGLHCQAARQCGVQELLMHGKLFR